VWSVENDPFEDFTYVEDLEDFEQQQVLVEGKSLLHPLFILYNMHFNYTTYLFIYLLFCINMKGPII
jgi:hypothetical protein